MEESGFNQIAENKYRKFPVNWLPEEFNIIQRIATEEYNGVVAQYIRRTIKRDLRQRGLVGPNAQAELFREYVPVQVEKHKIGVKWANRPAIEYPDPPKKYMGFIGGLRRNQFVYRWFAKKAQRVKEINYKKEVDTTAREL